MGNDGSLSSVLSSESPWPGLRPFEEEDAAYFAGRERESDELLSLIRWSRAVVLYGLSGLGKTSLLKAGLFPLMRSIGLLPIHLRLRYDRDSAPIAGQIGKALTKQLADRSIVASPAISNETLWEYFHAAALEFRDAASRRVTPVLVLDQFEEVFTLDEREAASGAKIEDLRIELDALLEHRPPAAVRNRLDENPLSAEPYDLQQESVKVIICLREDFLPQLDVWRFRTPSLLQKRYRLESMDVEQARQVVLKPGGHLVDPEIASRIVELANDSRLQKAPGRSSGPKRIEPTLLSLVCARLNARRLSGRLERIDDKLLTVGEEIIDQFYDEAFRGLRPEVREWVENELVTASGYRQQVEENEALAAVERGELAKLVDNHLLHREVHRDKGGYWVELTHDRLTDPARRSRDVRLQRETFKTLARKAEQMAATFRGYLSRPGPCADSGTAAALREFVAAIPEGGVTDEVRAWQAVCLALAAEVFVECAKFDEASDYAGRATGLCDEPRLAGTAGTHPLAVARIQAAYVAGMVALETGGAEEAEPLLRKAFEWAADYQGDPAKTDLTCDMIRVRVRCELKLAEIASSSYDYEASRTCLESAQQIADTATQVPGDEVASWRILAWLRRAKSEPSESRTGGEWLTAAEKLLADRLELDKANARWRQMKIDLLLLRSELAVEKDAWTLAKSASEEASQLIEDTTAALKGEIWFRVRSARCDLMAGRLHTLFRRWTPASDFLERAYTNASALALENPRWIPAEWDAGLCEWHRASLAKARYENTDPHTRLHSDVDTAIRLYEANVGRSRALLGRIPNDSRLKRWLAVSLGAIGDMRLVDSQDDAAQALYRQALETLLTIPEPAQFFPDVQSAVAYYQERLAKLAEKQSDPREMIGALGRAIDAIQVLAKTSKTPSAYFKIMSDYHRRIAAAEVTLGQISRAEAEYRMALDSLDQALTQKTDFTSVSETSDTDELAVLLSKAKIGRDLSKMDQDDGRQRDAARPLYEAGEIALKVWNRLRTPEVGELLETLTNQMRKLAEQLERPASGSPESGGVSQTAASLEDGSAAAEAAPALEGDYQSAALPPTADTDRLRWLARRIDQAVALVPEGTATHDGIRVTSQQQNWSLPPLMPGGWRTLSEEERAKEFKNLPERLLQLVPPSGAFRIRVLTLECYAEAQLFEAEVPIVPDNSASSPDLSRGTPASAPSVAGRSSPETGDGTPATVLYLRFPIGFALLHGASTEFRLINQKGLLRIRSAKQFVDYLSLFVNALQAEHGRFVIVDSAKDLRWDPSTPGELVEAVQKAIRPLVTTSEPGGGWSATATINYGDVLFYARFNVDVKGELVMVTDAWWARGLPVILDMFVGAVRTIPRGQYFKAARNLAVRQKNWKKAGTAAAAWAESLSDGDAKPPKDLLSDAYHDLTLLRLLQHNPKAALKAAQRGITLATETDALTAARGHALLYLGRVTEADGIYFRSQPADVTTEVKKEDAGAWVKWQGRLLEDWDRLEKGGAPHAEFERLRERLKLGPPKR